MPLLSQCTSTARMIADADTSAVDGHVEWAQQSACQDLHANRLPMLRDAVLKMHARLILTNPTRFRVEPRITLGEAWHSTHHAWPDSARLGTEPGQADPGWWLLRGLERLGLVWNLKQPGILQPRPGFRRSDGVTTEARL